MRTVSQVAEMANITVRTLHHYDEIGLLRPGARTATNYRQYDRDDLERLHEILVYRELGFELAEIRRLLEAPDHDRVRALHHQRELLGTRVDRLRAMVAAVDRMLQAEQEDKTMSKMTDEQMFEVWGDFDPGAYAAEAGERWGGSDAYVQSQQRAADYGVEQWRAIKAEGDEISRAFVALMDDDVEPTSPQAMALAEQHRAHISRWFYDCSYEIHRGLGEMYVADERFTRNIDEHAEGLAAYMRDAMVANADAAS